MHHQQGLLGITIAGVAGCTLPHNLNNNWAGLITAPNAAIPGVIIAGVGGCSLLSGTTIRFGTIDYFPSGGIPGVTLEGVSGYTFACNGTTINISGTDDVNTALCGVTVIGNSGSTLPSTTTVNATGKVRLEPVEFLGLRFQGLVIVPCLAGSTLCLSGSATSTGGTAYRANGIRVNFGSGSNDFLLMKQHYTRQDKFPCIAASEGAATVTPTSGMSVNSSYGTISFNKWRVVYCTGGITVIIGTGSTPLNPMDNYQQHRQIMSPCHYRKVEQPNANITTGNVGESV